jgi:uncharacterized protein (DUF1697 family)
VNVGKGNKVPMAAFRTALEDLGYTQVRTLLNSGNAVFDATSRSGSKLASAIAKTVEERFGVVTPVIVKSAAEFEAIVKANPFTPPESEHSRFIVACALDNTRLQELESLASLLKPGERFAVTEHAAYLHCAGGILESKAGEALLGRGGRGVTTRNWATVLKLLSLVRDSAD